MIRGHHIIVDFLTNEREKLFWSLETENFIFSSIDQCGFQTLGKVSHKFENGSYSIVVALAESHFSIHTWPEKQLVAMDLFVSDYLKRNDESIKILVEKVREYFQPFQWDQQDISRFENLLLKE